MSKQYAFSAPEAMVKALKELARVQKRSFSYVVGQIVQDYLDANPVNIEGGTEPPDSPEGDKA